MISVTNGVCNSSMSDKCSVSTSDIKLSCVGGLNCPNKDGHIDFVWCEWIVNGSKIDNSMRVNGNVREGKIDGRLLICASLAAIHEYINLHELYECGNIKCSISVTIDIYSDGTIAGLNKNYVLAELENGDTAKGVERE